MTVIRDQGKLKPLAARPSRREQQASSCQPVGLKTEQNCQSKSALARSAGIECLDGAVPRDERPPQSRWKAVSPLALESRGLEGDDAWVARVGPDPALIMDY